MLLLGVVLLDILAPMLVASDLQTDFIVDEDDDDIVEPLMLVDFAGLLAGVSSVYIFVLVLSITLGSPGEQRAFAVPDEPWIIPLCANDADVVASAIPAPRARTVIIRNLTSHLRAFNIARGGESETRRASVASTLGRFARWQCFSHGRCRPGDIVSSGVGKGSMRRILAVRQDNNGDVTLIGPALRALAAQGEVTLMCGPSGAGAAGLLPSVAATLVARADWIEGEARPVDAQATLRSVAAVAAARFTEAFVFTSFHQSPLPTALLLRLAGVPRIAAISVDYPGSLLDTRVNVGDDLHEVERALALVAASGYTLPQDDDARLRYAPLPSRDPTLPRDYVAIQPGASVAARAWAPEKLRAVVARLAREGHSVVILGSEREVELATYVAGSVGHVLAGRTSFGEFAAAIRDARALVVGNTSGIHVAGAVGTPVVTIFPPTIPARRFRPWRVPYVLLGDQAIACAGCRARACPLPGQPCTGVVTPADVVAALGTLGVAPLQAA
jgi:ADP-heptose:LPS heptosyltransferase